jgi:hypothetical protein
MGRWTLSVSIGRRASGARIGQMKQRHLRVGDELGDDEAVVVRGGELDREILRSDALRNHVIYGSYGISVFAVRDLTLDELAQQRPLVRFERLTIMTAGVLRAAGLRLEATGRNPRHFDVTFDDLDDGVDRLCHCEHRVVLNPYHEG